MAAMERPIDSGSVAASVRLRRMGVVAVRALFLVNVLLLTPQGIGLISPANIPFPITVTPLNARFIGALYLAAAVGMILSAFGRNVADLRIFLFGFSLISILVLIVTTAYWGDFTAKRLPVVWLVTYVVDPIAAAIALVALQPLRAAEPGQHRWTVLLLVAALVLAVVGIFSLAAPTVALAEWPWKISALLAQVYGAFLLSFAIGAALAAYERRTAAIRPVLASTTALAGLTLLASLLHLDRFTLGPASVLWCGVWAAGLVAFAILLVQSVRPTRTG